MIFQPVSIADDCNEIKQPRIKPLVSQENVWSVSRLICQYIEVILKVITILGLDPI